MSEGDRQLDLIFAHFLFTDGYIALQLKKKLKIPYIVAISNTDINWYLALMPGMRSLGLEIVMEAEKVFFSNKPYQHCFIEQYVDFPEKIKFSEKSYVIPYGVHPFGIKNKAKVAKTKGDDLKLLYVGDFTPNKNVNVIIQAVEELTTDGYKISLTLVGGGGL